MWPKQTRSGPTLYGPETKPVRVGILTQPFPPPPPPPSPLLPSFHWKFSALPFRLCHRRTFLFISLSRACLPPCYLSRPFPPLPSLCVRAPLQLVSHSNKTNLHVISLALLKFLNILHEMLKTLNGFPHSGGGGAGGVVGVWVYGIWGLQLLAGSARSG